ncbi:MAG: 4Fe-4S dicluster domain-containing protein [Deltaproteobacteria bacterium]|nr:4Fe-4S dicluster domain-containing protein [Deltaproteobacteria bacterium]
MGHLGRLKDEYRALASRLGAGTTALPEPDAEAARQARQDLLQLLYTPDEARLASLMPVLPSSLEDVARRASTAPEALTPRLEELCDKGLVIDLVSPTTGKTTYMLAPPVIGFFEFSMMRSSGPHPQKAVAEAIHAYAHGDRAFMREVFAHPTVIGRALPHEAAFDEEELPEVLDWERATSVLREARSLAVSLCFCRHAAQHLGRACASPMESCLSLNAGADFVIRRRFGRAIGSSEALEILAAARERALVQIADNVQRQVSYICNCGGCCCEQLRAISEFDLRAVNPSGFEVHLDEGACAGCSRCARACPIGAIQMVPQRVEGRTRADLRPAVDPERCIGCGVCTGACHKDALSLKRAAKPPLVPADVVEKAVRMAIERGRLAHLVADEGAGRGALFLNRVLAALLRLPPAKQVLAHEQLRSRFVRFALSQVEDPTA